MLERDRDPFDAEFRQPRIPYVCFMLLLKFAEGLSLGIPDEGYPKDLCSLGFREES